MGFDFRQFTDESVVITKSSEPGTLLVFTATRWTAFLQKLDAMVSLDPGVRRIRRWYYADAAQFSPGEEIDLSGPLEEYLGEPPEECRIAEYEGRDFAITGGGSDGCWRIIGRARQ